MRVIVQHAPVVQTLLGVADENNPPITLSIGITVHEADMADWEALFSQADQAMYEAKQSGENRVVARGPQYSALSPADHSRTLASA